MLIYILSSSERIIFVERSEVLYTPGGVNYSV